MRGRPDFFQPYSPVYPSAAGDAVDLSWVTHAREGAPILMEKQLEKFSEVLTMEKNNEHWNCGASDFHCA